jgi:LmbE family N-acetylglucosaminyl deacetylase
MARVTEAGGSVTVVTATRGEQGTDDPALRESAAFGTARQRELEASLAGLGVTDLRILGLPDGGCDEADDETQIRALSRILREVEPDTIVTFGPDGITNHPDHRAVSRWATEAWRRTASAELLYAAVTFDHLERFAAIHEEIGVYADFGDDGPPAIGRSRVALECALTEVELDRKRAALAEHASQTVPLAEQMGEDTYRIWWREETFRRPAAAEVHCCPVPDWVTAGRVASQVVGSPS